MDSALTCKLERNNLQVKKAAEEYLRVKKVPQLFKVSHIFYRYHVIFYMYVLRPAFDYDISNPKTLLFSLSPTNPHSHSQRPKAIDISCNVNTTFCMVFNPTDRTKNVAKAFQQFHLGGSQLQFVPVIKYLGQ